MLWKLARQLTRKSISYDRKKVCNMYSVGGKPLRTASETTVLAPAEDRFRSGGNRRVRLRKTQSFAYPFPPVKPRPRREKSANEAYNIDRFPPCPPYLVYLAEIVDRKDQLLPSQTGGGRSAHGNNISSKQSSRPAGENE